MAELSSRDRLQPSLLDRLTDDNPHEPVESREQRTLSLERLRECVLRDLRWLLNTQNYESSFDLSEQPQVRTSVINYGIPVLAGMVASGLEISQIERQVAIAIKTFEPRIIADSLKVRVLYSDQTRGRQSLGFEIDGELWAQPLPLRMFLRTELDLETGDFSVKEGTR